MILLDTSYSTCPFTQLYLNLINKILENRFQEDLFSIATFSDILRFIYIRDFVSVPLTQQDLVCRGPTALYDSLGAFLKRIENFEEKIRANTEKHTVIVITDGHDTVSQFVREHDIETQIHLLRNQGWEFIFLGIHEQSISVGERLGFTHRILYEQTPRSFEAVSHRIIGFLETRDPFRDLDLRFGNMSI